MTSFSSVPPSDPMSAVEAFRTAIAEGDIKGIAQAHVEDAVTIIDSISPFIWSGPAAVSNWMSSLTLHVERQGIRDGSVFYDAPITKLTDRNHQAYVALPAIWSYRAKGIAMRDTAMVAFALRQTPAGWKIAGWSWNQSNGRRFGCPIPDV